MAKITFDNKVTLNQQPSIARENKVIDDDMNEIKSVVNTNDDSLLGLKGTILWTNPNPSNVITTSNIALSSNDYDVLEVYCNTSTTTFDLLPLTKIIKGKGGQLLYANSNVGVIGQRILTRVDDTHYTIGAYVNLVGTGGEDGNRLIPLYIVGYKTGLFN